MMIMMMMMFMVVGNDATDEDVDGYYYLHATEDVL